MLVYFVSFLRFARKLNRERYIQDLNATVDNILKHKDTDMRNVVIDITDYTEWHSGVEYPSDAYLDDLAGRRLVYMDDVKMWVKVNKR